MKEVKIKGEVTCLELGKNGQVSAATVLDKSEVCLSGEGSVNLACSWSLGGALSPAFLYDLCGYEVSLSESWDTAGKGLFSQVVREGRDGTRGAGCCALGKHVCSFIRAKILIVQQPMDLKVNHSIYMAHMRLVVLSGLLNMILLLVEFLGHQVYMVER